MQLAIRSSLTAGVALVGATAIALSPIAPPAPNLTIKAPDISSVYADYTPTSLASAIQDIVTSVSVAAATGVQGVGLIGQEAIAGVGAIGDDAVATVANTVGALSAGAVNALSVIASNPLNPGAYPAALALLLAGGGAALTNGLLGVGAVGE